MTKCEICHNHEAEYAVQYIEDDGSPEFYVLGRHIYGYPVTRVCLDCYWDIAKRKEQET